METGYRLITTVRTATLEIDVTLSHGSLGLLGHYVDTVTKRSPVPYDGQYWPSRLRLVFLFLILTESMM